SLAPYSPIFSVIFFSLLFLLPPTTSTLFPYTTLFRSSWWYRLNKGKVGRSQSRRKSARLLVEKLEDRAVPALSYHGGPLLRAGTDRKSTRLNSSHQIISYAVFCLKKKTKKQDKRSEST